MNQDWSMSRSWLKRRNEEFAVYVSVGGGIKFSEAVHGFPKCGSLMCVESVSVSFITERVRVYGYRFTSVVPLGRSGAHWISQ